MGAIIENLGEIKFKVKLIDTKKCHDIVLKWSEESRSYEGPQLFQQLAAITGIPSKHTVDLRMVGGKPPRATNPVLINNLEAELNKDRQEHRNELEWVVCNRLVKEIVHSKDKFDCDCFVLKFCMWCAPNKHFTIAYELLSQLLVPETGCFKICLYRNTKAILRKMKSIIKNDALHAQMENLLVEPSYNEDGNELRDRDERRNVLMHFNVAQYEFMPCKYFGYRHHHGHGYLRTHG